MLLIFYVFSSLSLAFLHQVRPVCLNYTLVKNLSQFCYNTCKIHLNLQIFLIHYSISVKHMKKWHSRVFWKYKHFASNRDTQNIKVIVVFLPVFIYICILTTTLLFLLCSFFSCMLVYTFSVLIWFFSYFSFFLVDFLSLIPLSSFL